MIYIEITLLSREQIFGEDRLKIFDEYGTKAAITDFAILLGGYVNDYYHYNNNNSLEDRTGYYWTSSGDMEIDVCVVFADGDIRWRDVYDRCGGARLALPYSSIQSISSNVMRGRGGIIEVEYGEYPQKVASKILQIELERAYKYIKYSIRKTGKKYTTDSRKYNKYFEGFNDQEHKELKYKGKRYVRVKANSCYNVCEFTLSNGERYQNEDFVWIEVSPIKWLVDVEKDIALSERILFAGVQFNPGRTYKGNFKKTFMYKYLNTIFIKDIHVQPKEIEISVIEEKSKRELELEKLEKDKQKILSLRRNLGK